MMPPLVAALRRKVQEWRAGGYVGATDTSRTLLHWWFDLRRTCCRGPTTPWPSSATISASVRAVGGPSSIWWTCVAGVQDKYDLMRYDSSGAVSTGCFDETWRRFVVKMATGSGKTKVLSLALAWSFFHKLYEADSPLARNFLVYHAQHHRVDRIRRDFDGLRNLLFQDPVLPDNGVGGRNWRDDFQLTVHIQDEVHITRPRAISF
jgi:type III restriction enzyme